MMYWSYGMGWMMLIWPIVLAAVLVAAFFLLKVLFEKGEEGSPIEILKKRYARGDISKEEYEEMKKDLA